MEDKKDTKEWCMWVDPTAKAISAKQIPNSKKKTFQTEAEMIDFGARLMMKGFKMG